MMSLRSCDSEVLTMHDCVNHSLPSLMPIADVDLSPYATQDHRATTETMERDEASHRCVGSGMAVVSVDSITMEEQRRCM